MNRQIEREKSFHGKNWSKVHGGYFANPDVASPLVHKVLEFANLSGANTIVDLGGGIGTLLSMLRTGVSDDTSLVNLDDSTIQLDVARANGISCIHGSVNSFSRNDVGDKAAHFLFFMRSVLHYFGEDGLPTVLRHLYAQIRPTEYFVHQTASFRHQEDADCLNDLYRMMRTNKWYPTVDILCKCLRDAGWLVVEILPCAPLPLTSDELAQRYSLDQADISHISDQLFRTPIASENILKKTDHGFCAFLHYWMYVCTPIAASIPTKEETDRNRTETPGAGCSLPRH
jgi:hypothetical protein